MKPKRKRGRRDNSAQIRDWNDRHGRRKPYGEPITLEVLGHMVEITMREVPGGVSAGFKVY